MGWAIAASVAGSLISGFFGSRSAKKQQKAQEKAQRLSDQYRGYMQDKNRKFTLEDRRYKEDAVGAYRGFYGGNRQIAAPVLTDPNSVVLRDPYAASGGRG